MKHRCKHKISIDQAFKVLLYQGVLTLIAMLDGANACLFHMEQHTGEWRYRARWPESGYPALREWGEVRQVAGGCVFMPLTDPLVPVEVEWCAEGEEEWRAAEPWEFMEVPVRFRVEMGEGRDFREDPLVRAMALVRGLPCAYELEMPRKKVAEGDFFEMEGKPLVLGPGMILREAGEFLCESAAYRITNLEPTSQAALLPVVAAEPGSVPSRGTFCVKKGSLTADEVAALEAWKQEEERRRAADGEEGQGA